MKKLKLLSLLVLTLFLNTACDEEDEQTILDFGISDPQAVSEYMNANLILPSSAFTINPEDVEIDNSVQINSFGNDVVPISGGQTMDNNISFSASNGNVDGVGMRFGTSGPIYFVPINTNGSNSGVGSFQFSLPAEICNNLSKICHDIKCYEFAKTSAGNISQANIRDVAMLCGNCDEPSCQEFVDPSDCYPPGTAYGSFNSSISGNQSGFAGCSGGTVGVVSDTWTLSIVNVGSSGSFSIDADYYDGCSSCAAIQITDDNGTAYIAVSGSASWNGNTFSFNVSVKDIDSYVNNTGSSYNLNGSVSCN
ncbi:hypothetical protein [Corallibacter sp.]|uniref:hypothetical protein n=1 Tax=Corallibacter sp. TaxID=2038084 RepID=UPI003AB1E0C5